MSKPALKINFEKTEQPSVVRKISETVFETHTEELIIGLCGPIGTNLHYVALEISRILEEKYGYETKILRLSDFIREHSLDKNYNGLSKFQYINKLIEEGNQLRKTKGSSILAELAISQIAYQRELKREKRETSEFKTERVCYIIDSIKNKEELELFRLIYNDIFYFFGAFSTVEVRELNLEKLQLKKEEIYKLMDRDSGEEIQFGQKVADTFVQADFFLRIDQSTSPIITTRIQRFLSLIFSSEVITPSTHETAMYLASAASGNSACLSRQVGASITDVKGEVISVGWNDVPKVSGGVYQFNEDSSKDFRCINLEGGKCFNDEEKQIIRDQLVADLIKKGLIQESRKEETVKVIRNSRIRELVEFSRAVHAEMLAIIQGSQTAGEKIKNGKLYTTTYPCHNCARHIVAAGIREVYYIEPYRKSLAIKLHNDSLTEDEEIKDKVRILMYDGVAPRRYLEFFKMSPNSRKTNGVMNKPNKKTIFPRTTISLQAIPILEKRVVDNLVEKDVIKVSNET
jgi:deoxycytidylate deaminase